MGVGVGGRARRTQGQLIGGSRRSRRHGRGYGQRVRQKSGRKCFRKFLEVYQEVCALLVSAEKRIWFACNSIPMPPARYMLQHKRRQEKCVGRGSTPGRGVERLTCLSCSSELTRTLQISQWKVRS